MSLTDRIKQSFHKITDPVKRLLLRKSTVPQEIVTSDQAFEWCQHFLCNAWSTITMEQMHIERIPGGLSNYLYCCSLPDDVQLQGNEPRKVLLRIYGESHRKHRDTLLVDTVVCALLSERKLGPRVYGIFAEGRIEEFVEAESLLVSEIRDSKISQTLGRLLGELHQLDMPLAKEPTWLYRTTERYLADLPTDTSKFEIVEDRQIFQELRSVCDFAEEFENLKNILASVNSSVCFTHNDFQPGNILRLKSQPDNFTIIDFEYCSYNYRGFDIGNHFCEFMFDYKSPTEWPFFLVDFKSYPNKDEQTNFLSSYIDGLLTTPNSNDSTNDISDKENKNLMENINREELLNQIMKEANYFALASHFFWTLWAITMATSTTIKFGYMEYARTRLTAYYLTRELLIGANQIPPNFDDDLLCSTKNPFRSFYMKTDSQNTSK